MEGKIVKLSFEMGIIAYDIDKRISFHIDEGNFKIGDLVKFEIEKVDAFPHKIEVAKNIQIVRKQIVVDKKVLRLSKAARTLNQGISTLVSTLEKHGFLVDSNPNAKITEEQYQILEKHFSSKNEFKKKPSSNLERGTIIETHIKKIIKPSLLVLEFSSEKDAYLDIHNLAWNFARSEKSISSFNEKDPIQVVILENKPNYAIVSRKHLISKPNETKAWQEINSGQVIQGTIQELLVNKAIIRTELDFYGLVNIPFERKEEFIVGSTFSFILKSKDDDLQFLNLILQEEEIIIEEEYVEKEDFLTTEIELRSLKEFKNSIYYSHASNDQKKQLERLFVDDINIFSNAISFNTPLYLNFRYNLPAWEKGFKNDLFIFLFNEPYNKEKEKEALNYLERQKFWIRYNQYIDDDEIKYSWSFFNEKIFLNGFIALDSEQYDFIITRLTIERTNKSSSKSKEISLNLGTYLFNGQIKVLSPYESKPLQISQKEYFLKLQNKTLAFEILNKLKKETGTILRDEGLSIAIFDKFLEFQESLAKKGINETRIKIEPNQWEKIPHSKTELAIEIDLDLDDLFEGMSEDGQFIAIRTIEKSHKEQVDSELVWYNDAICELKNDKSILHLKNNEKPLDLLDKGFYIEKKVSTKQFQVQREVIKDFFDKKLKLDHIESLLLRPEKIKPPIKKDLIYFNEIFNETEKKHPNNNQINAVKKAVENKNIFLIQGPPGTGKTTVITEIVEQLVKKGERVLVTSQTHVAVDNVLEKISKNKKLTSIRIGNIQRIKEELKPFHIDKLIDNYSDDFKQLISTNILLAAHYKESDEDDSNDKIREELRQIIKTESISYSENIKENLLHKNYEFVKTLINTPKEYLGDLIDVLNYWIENLVAEKEVVIKPLLYSSVDVVFATCIGIRTDKDLNEYGIKFNTVIIDEAGKANISESLASISMAQKVILVGDQMQLPPYIDGNLLDESEPDSFPKTKFGADFIKEDIEHALKTSFFEFLVNRIKTKQFPKENIELLNYQHRMHPHIGEFISESFYEGMVKMGEHTYKNVLPLNSPLDKEIVFVNTSTVKNPYESFDGFSARNESEAICISKLVVPKLLEAGISPENFAIVAPYKSQVSLIKKHLASMNRLKKIDVSTLDSFQGMEFDVIIFSFTRSASPEQKNKKVGFLDDARRLNVAFSRAKKKLILVGNSETLVDSKSHFNILFNYTNLFQNLVKLSKNEKIGNFVNLTDFKDLKSPFELFYEKNKVGATINGIVKAIKNYGVFVNLGLIDGLILKEDLSWRLVRHPDEVVSLNQEVKIKILKFDIKKKQVALGLKQLTKSPCSRIEIGKMYSSKIVHVYDYGILVTIQNDVKGLVPLMKLKNNKKTSFKNFYKVGMSINVIVIKIDEQKNQLLLKQY